QCVGLIKHRFCPRVRPPLPQQRQRQLERPEPAGTLLWRLERPAGLTPRTSRPRRNLPCALIDGRGGPPAFARRAPTRADSSLDAPKMLEFWRNPARARVIGEQRCIVCAFSRALPSA